MLAFTAGSIPLCKHPPVYVTAITDSRARARARLAALEHARREMQVSHVNSQSRCYFLPPLPPLIPSRFFSLRLFTQQRRLIVITRSKWNNNPVASVANCASGISPDDKFRAVSRRGKMISPRAFLLSFPPPRELISSLTRRGVSKTLDDCKNSPRTSLMFSNLRNRAKSGV